MNDEKRFEPEELELVLQAVSDTVQKLAIDCRGDSLKLLAILRTLESLHQELRDTLFQEALPDNRQALYQLLKDIEASGGWPYIHRMRLQSLLRNLQTASDNDLASILPGIERSSNQTEIQGSLSEGV